MKIILSKEASLPLSPSVIFFIEEVALTASLKNYGRTWVYLVFSKNSLCVLAPYTNRMVTVSVL